MSSLLHQLNDRQEQQYQRYVAYCQMLGTRAAERHVWLKETNKITAFNRFGVNTDGRRRAKRNQARDLIQQQGAIL